jgi:hypothetical protein
MQNNHIYVGNMQNHHDSAKLQKIIGFAWISSNVSIIRFSPVNTISDIGPHYWCWRSKA